MKLRYTTVELLLLIASMGVILVLLVSALRMLLAGHGSTVEEEAITWAHGMALDVKGVECTTVDTNNDGYVFCTLSIMQGGKIEMVPVECAGKFNINNGCRMQKSGGLRLEKMWGK